MTSTAVKAAAAAAATGLAAMAARKALSSGSSGSSDRDEEESQDEESQDEKSKGRRSAKTGSSMTQSIKGSALGAGWEAAQNALIPTMVEAASAAGEYLGKSGPDVVREKIVPSFISGFQKTAGD